MVLEKTWLPGGNTDSVRATLKSGSMGRSVNPTISRGITGAAGKRSAMSWLTWLENASARSKRISVQSAVDMAPLHLTIPVAVTFPASGETGTLASSRWTCPSAWTQTISPGTNIGRKPTKMASTTAKAPLAILMRRNVSRNQATAPNIAAIMESGNEEEHSNSNCKKWPVCLVW